MPNASRSWPARWRPFRGAALGLVALCLAAVAQARCSRPLQAPVAPIGLGVTVEAGQVGGVYPTVLREWAVQQGCELQFSPVPRARQELLLENGHADLMIPASRSSRRDAWGDFVPLLQARPAAISLGGRRLYLSDLDQVLARKELRLAVVRGFDFGERYREVLAQMRQAGRLVEEVDAVAVARVLQAGMADLTVMTPTIMWGALQGDERISPLAEQLRVDALQDFDWSETGVYLSRQALPDPDRRHLLQMFRDTRLSQRVWTLTVEAYAGLPLEGWMRPVPTPPLSAAKPSRRGPSSP